MKSFFKRSAVIAALCVTAFSLTSAVHADPPASAEVHVAVSRQTVTEGETVTFSFYINSESEDGLEIESGRLALAYSDALDTLFSPDDTEITWADGVTFDSETELFTVSPARVFTPSDALLVYGLTVKDDALADGETSAVFTLSVGGGSYLVSGGEEIPVTASGAELTVLPAEKTVSATVNLIGNLLSTDNLTAKITDGEHEYPLVFGEIAEGKVTAVLDDLTQIEAGSYKLTVSGDGYIAYESGAFDPADGFRAVIDTLYPGDLNADGRIDFLDFHALCVYINGGEYAKTADLNGDGGMTQDDADCFTAGYLAKGAAQNE
ncbi:MAG: dockerin type I domain-containing protein [Clostridiales bacterium]|nr:dockerin type I domain-containing protein [Clostridiales bacterium]